MTHPHYAWFFHNFLCQIEQVCPLKSFIRPTSNIKECICSTCVEYMNMENTSMLELLSWLGMKLHMTLPQNWKFEQISLVYWDLNKVMTVDFSLKRIFKRTICFLMQCSSFKLLHAIEFFHTIQDLNFYIMLFWLFH